MLIREDIFGNVFDKGIDVCDERDVEPEVEDDGWTTVWPPRQNPSRPAPSPPVPAKGEGDRARHR